MAEFSTYELVILFSAIITLLYVAYRFMYLLYESVKEKVKSTSKRYNDILNINANYNFHNDIRQEYPSIQRLKTKQQFDRFNYDRFFQEDIEKSKAFYDSLISKVNKNKALLDEYNVDISKASAFMKKNEIHKPKIPFIIYSWLEEKICFDILLKPITNPKFVYRIEYTSPKGRNHYKDKRTYSFHGLNHNVDIVNNKIKIRKTRKYQRNKMTDSLRYDILKRDNFRCVICGRTADDDIKLHVDHIKPISKGGKTIRKNLRTLCNSCNIGKSNKYDKDGIN